VAGSVADRDVRVAGSMEGLVPVPGTRPDRKRRSGATRR
jgi:hypothetical protein